MVDSVDKPVVDNMDTRGGAGVAKEMTLVALSAWSSPSNSTSR